MKNYVCMYVGNFTSLRFCVIYITYVHFYSACIVTEQGVWEWLSQPAHHERGAVL